MDVKANQVSDPLAFHAEGPFWDTSANRLLYVDLLAGDILSLDDGLIDRFPISEVAAVIRRRAKGGFVVAVERGFAFVDDDLQSVEFLPEVFGSPTVRMNEGGCDPQGRFYCGSMAYAETPGGGSLYRMDAGRSVHVVLEGVSISNGLQWSADGSKVFYNDSPSGRVDVFDFDADTAEFSHRRPFATPVTDGVPDGMAIDAEDGIWTALWGGSAVQHFDAAGKLVEKIELPVSHVSACTFGGPNLSTLFITTSRLAIAEGEEPEAGAIFSVETDVRGAVPHTFAG
jgi:sugar lactone lactonase YvrE